jgi:lipoic acid synthetase
MPLEYVVMTMVDRDDLLDGGADHVAMTVRRLKQLRPEMLVETLLGDFGGHMTSVDVTLDAGPDVWAHNIEVVERLQRTARDVRCSYERSLGVLRHAKEKRPRMVVKSSIMVGIGETDDEVLGAMRDLRSAGVDVLTLGQYLRPTPKHLPVERFVTPDQFEEYACEGREMGFAFVASGPLVRSSYKAAEVYLRSCAGVRESLPAGLRERFEAVDERGEGAAYAGDALVQPERLLRKPSR